MTASDPKEPLAISMPIFAAIVISLVMQTSDLCAEPFAGGVGEPDFCVLSDSTIVQTPYFSFEVSPRVLVGIDREGARAIVQGSIRQSQVHLVLEAFPTTDHSKLISQMGRCGEISAESDSILQCDWSSDGVVRIARLLVGSEQLILSELSAAGSGLEFLPDYRTILESIAFR